MAAMLGYKAYGIEIEEELVRLSKALAQRLRIPVDMICTSMFPKGYHSCSGVEGAELVKSESCRDQNDEGRCPLRYDGMDIDIAEIGLFFAYPWAEERALIQDLFEAVAAPGAILVVYHTDHDIRVCRKVSCTTDPLIVSGDLG